MATPTKEELERQERSIELVKQITAEISKQVDAEIKLARIKGENISAADRTSRVLEQQAIALENVREIMKGTVAERYVYFEEQKKQIEQDEKRSNKAKQNDLAELERLNQISEAYGNNTKHLESYVNQQQQRSAVFRKETENFNSMQGQLLGMVGLSTQFSQTITGGLMSGIPVLGNWMAGLKSTGEEFKALNTTSEKFGFILDKLRAPAEMIGGLIIGQTEQMIMAVDKATTAFVKSTGAMREYKDAVNDSLESLRLQGLDFTTVGIAAEMLYKNTTLLRNATQDTRTALIPFIGALEQAGVSSNISTQSLEILSSTLGITGVEATKNFEEIIFTARSLGMAIDDVAGDFVAASATLAAHGPKMEQVFKELTAQAAASGLATSDLMTIAAQFDTFEGAADAVGRLNGLLGGPYLNSIDMVYKTESERNKTILESVRMSGIAFGSLARYERMALAAAVGITDMAEANKFFGTTVEEYERAEMQALNTAAAQKTMADLAKEATTIMDNFKFALMQAALNAAPFIEMMRGMILSFSKILGSGPGLSAFFTMLSFAIGVKLVSAFVALKAALVSAQIAAGPVYWLMAGIAAVIAGGGLLTYQLMTDGENDDPLNIMNSPANSLQQMQSPTAPGAALPSAPTNFATRTRPAPIQTAAVLQRSINDMNAGSANQPLPAQTSQLASTRPVVIELDGRTFARGVARQADAISGARLKEGLPE